MRCECFNLNQVKHVKLIINTYLNKSRKEVDVVSILGSHYEGSN